MAGSAVEIALAQAAAHEAGYEIPPGATWDTTLKAWVQKPTVPVVTLTPAQPLPASSSRSSGSVVPLLVVVGGAAAVWWWWKRR